MSRLPPGTTHADIDDRFGSPTVCRGCGRTYIRCTEEDGHAADCEYNDGPDSDPDSYANMWTEGY